MRSKLNIRMSNLLINLAIVSLLFWQAKMRQIYVIFLDCRIDGK